MNNVFKTISVVIGVAGAYISQAFGGWDNALTTLVIFFAVDYILGIMVAAVFKKSKKTKTGALSSVAGFRGLCKKGVMLLIVLVAVRLDIVIGSHFIKDATIIAFIANETVSIIENAGLMGVPIPPIIKKAIDALKQSSESMEVGGEK